MQRDIIGEVILEDELRRAVMIKHPLTLRQMTGRFQFVVVYRLSKGRFTELFQSFVNEFEQREGLIAGSWNTDNGSASRAMGWCGENGERVMMVCDGSARRDASVIHLGFTNFDNIPDLACKFWKPIMMKSRDGENPWGIPTDELVAVETTTPPEEIQAMPELTLWTRFLSWLRK
jgi:hypothetical protein